MWGAGAVSGTEHALLPIQNGAREQRGVDGIELARELLLIGVWGVVVGGWLIHPLQVHRSAHSITHLWSEVLDCHAVDMHKGVPRGIIP